MSGDLHVVEHRRAPVALWLRCRDWLDSLLREFDIIVADADEAAPRDLVEFVESASSQFGQFTVTVPRRVEAAKERGDAYVDLEISLPAEAADAAAEFMRLIDAADRFCRRGDLMTLALDDELRSYLDWYLGEIRAQLAGSEPRPWEG